MATVFVEKEKNDHLRLINTSGADVVAGEFVVLGNIAGVADEAVANGAVGSFHVEEGLVVQAADFVTSEGTFGTGNADVFFDPTTKKFSDTETIGYVKVGQVVEILSGGVIRFAKAYFVEPVATFAALADVNVAGVTNNDTLKYDATSGKWVDVAVED